MAYPGLARTLPVMTETDIVLIGAGPIGLEMAVALQDAGLEYVHLEAKQVGQTISWFPQQARFFSSPERIAICGVPLQTVDQSKATREEYLAYLLGVVRQFNLPIRTYERVTEIRQTRDNSRYEIETKRADGQHAYRAKRVIFTIGDMHRPRPLTMPDGEAVEGFSLPHVNSYFNEPYPFFDKRLLIIGGRNSAVEAAIRCYRVGAKVALSYRRAELDSSIKYWLKPEIEWLIRHGEIEFFPQTVPSRITPTEVQLSNVDPQLKLTGQPAKQEPFDFVLSLIGYQMDSSLFEQAGIALEGTGKAPQLDPKTMETNLPGVYVAGTGAAGTQIRFKLFIENCHAHVVRIMRHLTGTDPQHVNPLAFQQLRAQALMSES